MIRHTASPEELGSNKMAKQQTDEKAEEKREKSSPHSTNALGGGQSSVEEENVTAPNKVITINCKSETASTTKADSPPTDVASVARESDKVKDPIKYLRFQYYQQFFDVNTDQVLRRLLWSVVPQLRDESYVELYIQPKPDLYGPLWIAATLACTTAMASTIVNVYYSGGKPYPQRSDYNKASVVVTVAYMYTFVVPSVVWSILHYKGESRRLSLLDLICTYGYSLAVYLPVSILWVLQPAWLQWVLVVIAAIVSGCVLLLSFKKVFDEVDKKVALVLILIIISLHMFVAFGFAAYFLQPSYSAIANSYAI